mmetsp:Transcript_39771/g.44519  ORF Transcript_39771/g.44519 Transcript_39771/m.44519 type:complete len:1291 (-) Transcript_39771:103-3975(-)
MINNNNNSYRNDSVSSSSHHRSSSGGGSHHRRGNSRRDRRPSNITNLPFEQGIICSLKESFGFIHCAERPEEIFFHYSEVTNCHPDELQIDTEVEFKVGTSGNGSGGGGGGDDNNKKFAAFQVKTVEAGTVIWETEEEEGRFIKGYVEKPISSRNSIDGGRGDGNGNGSRGFDSDGTIRIIMNDSKDNNDQNEKKDNTTDDKVSDVGKRGKNGPIVRLRAGECISARDNSNANTKTELSSSSNHNSSKNNIPRLFRGDFVEFRVLVDQRTKQKYARHIKLIQSERERKRISKEKRLLENATAEEGIIVSLNNGFGFIKSNKRREHIYYHFSHIIEPEKEFSITSATFEGDNDNNNNNSNSNDKQLHVAKTLQGNNNSKFEPKKGQEVKFLVVTEPSSERQNSNNNIQQSSSRSSSNNKVSARQVEFLPTGSVKFHTIEATGVKGMVSLVPHPPNSGSKNDDSKEGRIRLVKSLNTVEAEIGDNDEISTVEEVLLHYSDAPGGVFTYQNHRSQSVSSLWIHEGDTLLFDIIKETVDGCYRAIPTLHTIELGGSILKPNPDDLVNEKAQPFIRLVSLSMVGRAEGIVHTLKPDYGFIHFAERPINVHFKFYDLMPTDLQRDIRKQMGIEEPINLEEGAAVQFDICAHGNITTTSTGNRSRRGRQGNAPQVRENIRGQRVILLPKSIVTFEKSLATCAMGVIKSVDQRQLYAGVIEMKDDVKGITMEERHPLIAQMLVSFLHESALPNGRKSLVYRDTLGMKDDDIVVEMAKKIGKGVLECSHISVPGIGPHPGRLCIRRVENKGDDDKEETKDEELKGKRKVKSYKNIPFDKSGLDEALKKDLPPSPGDIVTFDVFQNRRSGNILVKNLKIVERNSVDASGLGVVNDVVTKRNFGFISVLDENSTKRELLFFHLPKEKRGNGYFSKGDEVKFNIALEGSKRIAINVESVRKGTIPSVASKNACLGYILMEPSHTRLSDTPIRKTKGGNDKVISGRWTENNYDSKKTPKQDMVEGGCILLLEDKNGMFQKKPKIKRRNKRSASIDSTDSSDDLSVDEAKSVQSCDGLSTDDELSVDGATSTDDECPEDSGVLTVLSRISYNNGSIAIHGSGSTSSMDNSANPRRGDLVSFVKGRKRKTARDIRVVERKAAILQCGRLINIQLIDTEDKMNKGKAQFIAAAEKDGVYDIDLAEVVSCAASILKEKESVEGIVHEGRVYGLCRTSDLYLTSKIGSGKNKQRPKLNLIVKKDRGGTIMAQSMMAKGPDGTTGFEAGWTKRISKYELKDIDDEEGSQ